MNPITKTIFYSLLITVIGSLSYKAISAVYGSIIDESGKGISGAIVSIGDQQVTTEMDGGFILKPLHDPIIKVLVTHTHYFTSIHSFSRNELKSSDHAQAIINPIIMVKKKPGRKLIAFAGDVMMTRRFLNTWLNKAPLKSQSYELNSSKQLLSPMKPYLSIADIASVNLETVIADKPLKGADKFTNLASSSHLISALKWAGVDHVNLANNHINDYLQPGLLSTLSALDNKAMLFSGAGMNEKEANKITLLKKHPTSNPIGLWGAIDWTHTGLHSLIAQESQGGAALANSRNLNEALTQRPNGQTPMAIHYHGGIEYSHYPTVSVEEKMKNMIDAGIDLIIGHHPHTLQGFEIYKNKLIVYSLGNFIFDQLYPNTQLSALLYVWMDNNEFHRAEIIPIHIRNFSPTPALGSERFQILSTVKKLSAQRGLSMLASGGHAVIMNEKWQKTVTKVQASTNQYIITPIIDQYIYSTKHHWQLNFDSIETNENDLLARFGRNIIHGGDFDSSFPTKKPDFFWHIEGSDWFIENKKGSKIDSALATHLKANETSEIAMSAFSQNIKFDNPLSLTMSVKTEEDIKIKLFWQKRPLKATFINALQNSKRHLFYEETLKSHKEWQVIEGHFNSPRVNSRGVRFIITFENLSKENHLLIDNVAWIEWYSTFKTPSETTNTTINYADSFIQFNRTPTKNVLINYKKTHLPF